eukprot:407180-Pleurochrysis_carterae.AAC.1
MSLVHVWGEGLPASRRALRPYGCHGVAATVKNSGQNWILSASRSTIRLSHECTCAAHVADTTQGLYEVYRCPSWQLVNRPGAKIQNLRGQQVRAQRKCRRLREKNKWGCTYKRSYGNEAHGQQKRRGMSIAGPSHSRLPRALTQPTSADDG